MCVIATSYKGFDVPANPVMKEMYDYNPDGAGFAYALNKRVYIEKGFMSYEDFMKALNSLQEKIKENYNKTLKDISIMFHFRIGTHGPNSPQLTHPFPIGHTKKHFDALDLYTDVVMAHNGVIKSVTPNTDWSDTTQYVKDVLYPMYLHDKQFFKSEHLRRLIHNTINGSRFVFLDKNGEFTYVGEWKDSDKKELKGVKFSNLNHEDTYLRSYYASGFVYDDYSWGVEEKIPLKKLPEGTILAKDSDFDSDYTLIKGAVTSIVADESPVNWYVNEFGEIFQGYLGSIDVYKSYSYDVALTTTDYKPYEFDYLTSYSESLLKVPLIKYNLMGYKTTTVESEECS